MIFWYSKQGVKLKIALGQDWLHQSGQRRKTGSNWFTETKIENERKNWIVCTRIFGRIWVTWSGSVLKFSFQLRPADCQNLIDIFHVLRNIQFNSDIKRPQCHWTLILISINMIRNWRGWGCLHHALLGACDEIAPSSHLQPGVHQPAHTSVQRKPGGYCIRPWLRNESAITFVSFRLQGGLLNQNTDAFNITLVLFQSDLSSLSPGAALKFCPGSQTDIADWNL